MNEERLEYIETVAKSATSGKWIMELPQEGGRVLLDDPRQTIIHQPSGSPFNSSTAADSCHIATSNPDTVLELVAEIRRLREDLEQERVRLAGCLTAAEGWVGPNPPNLGDYGWSPAFQAVLELRQRLEQLENNNAATDEGMTPDQVALSKELVSQDWWEWQTGLKIADYDGVVACQDHDSEWCEDCMDHYCDCPERIKWWFRDSEGLKIVSENNYIDLSDSATEGVLLGMLGESLYQVIRHSKEDVEKGRVGDMFVVEYALYNKPNVLGAGVVCYESGPSLGVAIARALIGLNKEIE